MDNQVLVKGLILLVGIIVLISGISYLVYCFFKRKNKQRISKIVGFGMFSVSIICTLYVMFGFLFLYLKIIIFLKNTAVKNLKQVDISLDDDFKVLENEIYKFTSYSHTFKLKISNNDANKLIENKKVNTSKQVLVRFQGINAYNSKKVIVDIEKNILIYRYESE